MLDRLALFLAGGNEGMPNHPLFFTIERVVFALALCRQPIILFSASRTWRVVSNFPSGSGRTNSGSDLPT